MRTRVVATLVYAHRWLGIAGAVLFAVWFVSGVAMMYARMPRLSAEERLSRAAMLDLDRAQLDPSAAAAALPQPPQRLRVGMLGDRPVYRFQTGASWTMVFADGGPSRSGSTAETALGVARQFAPGSASSMRVEARVVEPDQWTLQLRGLLPAHKIAFDDDAGTNLYVSEQTSEPILVTTRKGRWLGFVSAVLHWIYFTPIRTHSELWNQLIVWTSIAGTLLCLTGLVWGVWRFSSDSRYHLRGIPRAHSPYVGLLKWHHYTGLAFGAFTLTWVFSGLLSMDPWEWSPSTAPTRAQRDALTGGPIRWSDLTLDRLRLAAVALGTEVRVKEIEILQFRGELVAEAFRAPGHDHDAALHLPLGDPGAVIAPRVALPHALVRVLAPERGVFSTFDREVLEQSAREAMPDVEVEESTWLSTYDSYYYGRARCEREPCLAPTLPVLRVKFKDAVSTWLYLDPVRGTIARKEERLSRVNRWLYHGLHSLDFPWLYYRRPLWDIVVIALSIGGCVVSVTSAPTGWRRLRRHARRIRATMRNG